MALRSGKNFLLLCLFFITAATVVSQNNDRPGDADYKNGKDFERFYSRRKNVSIWQINQLKEGALVVILKTNGILVNALLKKGDTILAETKRLEMAAANINTIKAYNKNYTFSKLYFIYANSYDSLFKGVRKNIFIDTTLKVNPSISMSEKFYLLAERDYAVNSTIGFVPEDSARMVKEHGGGGKEMSIVVKNKYKHQLKAPFPYRAADRTPAKVQFVVVININGIPVIFNPKKFLSFFTKKEPYIQNGKKLILKIPKHYLYPGLLISVSNFNQALFNYYYKNSDRDVEKTHPELRPFFY